MAGITYQSGNISNIVLMEFCDDNIVFGFFNVQDLML